ncbi:hypothetical protein ACEW7V_02525 [Areca yellow leaf disease phytoplasma]|uniref:hypothetical protein n=1 Tax=Areca yellow leaf disease phytoplasma TaxID=927614 RepID=UPI0035B53F80
MVCCLISFVKFQLVRIKVGETVVILAGKDRFGNETNQVKKMTKTGKVLKVFAKTQKNYC